MNKVEPRPHVPIYSVRVAQAQRLRRLSNRVVDPAHRLVRSLLIEQFDVDRPEVPFASPWCEPEATERVEVLRDDADRFVREHGFQVAEFERTRWEVLRRFATGVGPLEQAHDVGAQNRDSGSSQGRHTEGDRPGTPPPSHSPDFRSVNWYGVPYSFTANQAPAVRMLYEAYQSGAPEIGDDTLLAAIDPESQRDRLRDVFRDCDAWGTMIVEGSTRGSRRLARP